MTVSSKQFRALMGSFAAGVTVVTTVDDQGTPWGLTVTAFSALSLDPPLCLACVDRHAASHPALIAARKFAVSMLSSHQQELSNRFASKQADKFVDVPWRAGAATGCPILTEALAWLECRVARVHDGGDHDIFVGEVLTTHVTDGHPLVYWRGAYGDVSVRVKPAG